MAVIDLRGSGRDLGDSFARLGAGLAGLFESPEARKRRELMREILLRNPQQANLLLEADNAKLGDANVRNKDIPSLSGAYGLSRMDLESIASAFPQTFEQKVDRAKSQRPGLVEQTVNTAAAVTGAEEKIAGAAGAEATNRQRAAERAAAIGLPEASEEHKLFQIGFENAKTEFEKVNLEIVAAAYGRMTPEQRARAAYGLINPAHLSDIQHREGLEVSQQQHRDRMGIAERQLNLDERRLRLSEASLALKQLSGTAEEAKALLQLRRQYFDEFNDISDRIREGKVNEGELEVLVSRMNGLSHDYLRMFPNEAVPIMRGIEAVFGKELKGAKFELLTPETRDLFRTNLIASKIISGEWKLSDLHASEDPNTVRLRDDVMGLVQAAQTNATKNVYETATYVTDTGFATPPTPQGMATTPEQIMNETARVLQELEKLGPKTPNESGVRRLRRNMLEGRLEHLTNAFNQATGMVPMGAGGSF